MCGVENLALRRGVGIMKCAYGIPPARQIHGIPLLVGNGHIIRRMDEIVRKWVPYARRCTKDAEVRLKGGC